MCLLTYGVWTVSLCIPWNCVRNGESRAPLQTYWIRICFEHSPQQFLGVISASQCDLWGLIFRILRKLVNIIPSCSIWLIVTDLSVSILLFSSSPPNTDLFFSNQFKCHFLCETLLSSWFQYHFICSSKMVGYHVAFYWTILLNHSTCQPGNEFKSAGPAF